MARGVCGVFIVCGVFAVGLAGCGGDTVIAVDDYAGSCAVDGDCVIVAFGDACEDACLTDNQAIAVDDLQRYRDDVDAAIATCGAFSDRRTAECLVPLPDIAPACVDGSCVVPDDGAACSFETGFCVGVDDGA